ncbi:FAD-binding oxidoreductase [Pseudolysinimonas sp.]|uniref:FAD-binding oxidoreductase n=1 Tax=Pseudolysinimonas sp. TaxID=2680009 RepID=UPI003F7D1AEE
MADFGDLARTVTAPVLLPHDDGYAAACTGFNTAYVPTPDAVLRPADVDDVVAAVRFAREAGIPIRILATGHGAHARPAGGLLLNLGAFDDVRIDADARTATFGGGVMWGPVIAAAAEHGLAPVTGSSATVGAVGFLLGGGFGPLARTLGAGSDRLVAVRVVTGTGEVVTASADENPDLFWALRGGKGGLGVVVEATVRLVEMPALYGGALFFDVADAPAVLDGWLAWARDADPAITTSFGVVRFPDLELVPPPLRGRHLANLKVGVAADPATGERLTAPLRAFAPVALDGVGPLPPAEIARISNDPTEPGPGWSRGFLLGSAGDGFGPALLGLVGSGTSSPFIAMEIRHFGGAIAEHADSPVGGRDEPFAVMVIGTPDPGLFDEVLPEAYAGLRAALTPWIAPTTTINWLTEPEDPAQFAGAWSPTDLDRLAAVRRAYDPDGVFPYGPAPAEQSSGG